MGIGRNAAHALQIVQSYPFGRQDGPHTADDFGQFLAFMDFIAIFDEKLEPDLVVQQSKGPGKDIEAGDDAVLFAQEFRFTLQSSGKMALVVTSSPVMSSCRACKIKGSACNFMVTLFMTLLLPFHFP